MEIDAIARFLQDAGNDDTDDADLPELGLAWIARRAVIEVMTPARPRENLTIRTWCSGTGSRWAERRTEMVGDRGAHVEAAMLWIHIDAVSGRPKRWGDEFADLYLEASGGREVSAKLHHPSQPPERNTATVTTMPWRFRRTDMDGFGHVNNAAYLAIVEENRDLRSFGSSVRVELEWRKPSVAGEDLEVVEDAAGEGVLGWVLAADELRATYAVRPVPLPRVTG